MCCPIQITVIKNSNVYTFDESENRYKSRRKSKNIGNKHNRVKGELKPKLALSAVHTLKPGL